MNTLEKRSYMRSFCDRRGTGPRACKGCIVDKHNKKHLCGNGFSYDIIPNEELERNFSIVESFYQV